MANEAAYCCAGLLFLVILVFFAVSMRTNSQTRRYCQGLIFGSRGGGYGRAAYFGRNDRGRGGAAKQEAAAASARKKAAAAREAAAKAARTAKNAACKAAKPGNSCCIKEGWGHYCRSNSDCQGDRTCDLSGDSAQVCGGPPSGCPTGCNGCPAPR